MNEKPVLTAEELEALLGGKTEQPASEAADSGEARAEAQDAAARHAVSPLLGAFAALTARVELLERQVKELRLQAIAAEPGAGAAPSVRRSANAPPAAQPQAAAPSAAPSAPPRLSRLETYGRRRR